MFGAPRGCSIDYQSDWVDYLAEMSPSSFTFKLTVPNDPEGASVVAVVATHAVEYASIDKAAGAAFVERAKAAALDAFSHSPGSQHCLIVFAAAEGQLTMTVGGKSVSQALPS